MCDYINRFEVYIRTELGLAVSTISAYIRDVGDFLDWNKNKEFTSMIVEDFVEMLDNKGLQRNSIARKLMSVRCFYNFLIATGRLNQNIVSAINSHRQEHVRRDPLARKDIMCLLAAINGQSAMRNRAIVLLLYQSGLRASELCSLDIDDLVVSRMELLVRGKGSRERVVPVTTESVDAIKKYLDCRQSTASAMFTSSRDNSRISRRAVSDMLMNLSRRAGIKHTTSHSLRHACATQMMNNGAELEVIQRILGHLNLSTTEQYLSLSQERIKEVYYKYFPADMMVGH